MAEAKKEIQDSIHYAKNIQEAMLPDVSVLSNYFPEGFGLFLPKDVVSGDFYWFGELDDVVYFAAADCTGHGVPGAFMSMIGIDKLNHALNDEGIRSVGAILSHLNVTIRKSLKQENTASVTKDGMDIALCSYDKKSNRLCYAGANRPLWILSGGVIVEYKATKSAIAGHTANDQLFEEHTIQLQSGDSIYLFSDGFADQFGGPDKKKFMTKRLRETILKLSVLPMQEQELAFQQLFIDWKGALAQVDDVLLLGFKVA